MEAKRLLLTTAFHVNVVSAMTRAFDNVWAEVARHFESSEITDAQTVLAKAIVANALDTHDLDDLKERSLNALVLHFPWLHIPLTESNMLSRDGRGTGY